MKNSLSNSASQTGLWRSSLLNKDWAFRRGMLMLLAIKDSDIRILTLRQSRDAVDKGLHAGGAFSATIPLVALFYGGFLRLNIEDPTMRGQDMFTLSKGHAVAALASIYADLGYFDKAVLKGSRSHASILNGHPGPILPGIQIATGPMGQGLGVAQGFAIAGRMEPRFDSYTMAGDGELQEGSIWEAVMYAGQHHLDNLCVLVDRNNGQLDIHNRMIFPMPDLDAVFSSFGWNVHDVDATQYDGVYEALEKFRFGPRNGRPTAILCNGSKGHGAFSDFMNKHKVTMTDAVLTQELALQEAQGQSRRDAFLSFCEGLDDSGGNDVLTLLQEAARQMLLDVEMDRGAPRLTSIGRPVMTRRVPPRDKRIGYDASLLPKLDEKKQYAASDIVTGAMKVFARDPRVISIDADLASTSGLEAGIAAVDQSRALNAGVAEENMMLIGEAFAALGYNAWVSTFCPFFNWQALRRIAVGQQERMEAIESPDSWLSEGHGLDLAFLATAANFETRTNGATHMGNDDSLTFDAVGSLRIIDVSCPQQMLAIMKWIMEGNRGLVYVRVMRTGSAVLYGADYAFRFGEGRILRETPADAAIVVSSGRGVHEALAASALCAAKGIGVTIVDMPSIDEGLLLELYRSGKLLVFAEQNNGFIWQNFLKALYRHRDSTELGTLRQVVAINTLNVEGKPQFIHSATYEELLTAFGLTPQAIAEAIQARAASPGQEAR
jgi:transketolase